MKFKDMLNTITLGDCYELIKNIPDNSIDLIIIDPPYLFDNFGGGCFGNERKKSRQELKDIRNGFDYKIFDELKRVMKKTNIYIFCSKTQLKDYFNIFLDCFSGSGTTCVAAKELGRNYIGIEINQEYHKISVDRLNGILANGQMSFDTILGDVK